MRLRRIVSLTLMLSIITMLVSSVVLFVVPQGRVAYWAEWSFLGLSKSQWGALHTNLGLLGIIAAFFHVYYNWKTVTGYMKNKAREFRLFTRNFKVAFAVVMVFAVLTVAQVPPMVWLQDLRGYFEESSARKLGDPPYGHAEESSLRVFVRNTGLEMGQVKKNLSEKRIEVSDPEMKVITLAKASGMSPQELFEIMKGPESQRPTGPLAIPESMPRGSGRKTLRAFCAEYNRDVDAAVAALKDAGWSVEPDQTLKDIAGANGSEALDLLDILRQKLPWGGKGCS